jgi:hypothetical protein
MKPIITLGETTTPDGSKFTLQTARRGFLSCVSTALQLMSSTWTLSERLLADCRLPGQSLPIKIRDVSSSAGSVWVSV